MKDASKASGTSPTLDPSMSNTEKSFLTPREIAAKLKVKVSTIHEWTRRRNTKPIPHYPVSRKVVYYKWDEVSAWIDSHRAA
jgi:predicted DNA-binding transcriptional regulator AlpA